MASDPRLRRSEGEILSARDSLRQLTEVLPGAADGYSFDPRRTDKGLELRLRYENNRGQVPTATREMGGETFISPLFSRALEGETYWVSVSIQWDTDGTGKRPYVFRTASVTLFQGTFEERAKMQLLRAEWAGLKRTGDGSFIYDSQEAAHPHWQVDAPRALRDRMRRQRDEEAARRALYDEHAATQEVSGLDELFAATVPSVIEMDEPDVAWCSMHLALNAPWHSRSWSTRHQTPIPHAHSPAGLPHIVDWLTWTVNYIQQEIAKVIIS